MALYRISDRYPNYPDIYFNGGDIKGMAVHSAEDARVGTVKDIFIDENNHIQFLVVDTGASQVLLPINRCASDFERNLVYVRSLNREEFKNLQPYSETGETYNQPEYALEQSLSVEDSAPVEGIAIARAVPETAVQDPVVEKPPAANRPIQLYEERLVTQKQRVKTGEVKISKRTITDTSNADIPITREKVIIEIESIYSGQTRVDFGDAEVAEDGTVRMDIYEEQAAVCQRIVPYQNVSVRKEVVQDVVRTQQVVRREELEVTTEGNPNVDWTETSRSPNKSPDQN